MIEKNIFNKPESGILRTPDEYFKNLPGYSFSPNYMVIKNFRIHYVDEGPKGASPILLLHGEPSWSYLYRKMIPPLINAGYRVVAPDLFGFGRSDKPVNKKDYTYQKHVDVMTELIVTLGLKDITLFCQDWGGIIGLRAVANELDRFSNIIAANTFLPAEKGIKGIIGYPLFRLRVKLLGTVTNEDLQKKANFLKWVAYSQTIPEFPVGDIIQGATISKLPGDVIDAYNAPFPDESYKAGARIFPMLVPSQLRQNQKVWEDIFFKWNKPFLTAFSDRDPITRGLDKLFLKRIPGTKNQPHVTIKDAGHFLQEDKGEELADMMINFLKK